MKRPGTASGRHTALLVVVVVVVLLVVGVVVIQTLDDGGTPSTSISSTSTSPTTGQPTTSSPPTSIEFGGDLAIGEVTPGGAAPQGCPRGFDCTSFEVTCPGVAGPSPGVLAVLLPPQPRGMVVLFSGSAGDGWWSTGQGRPAASMFKRLTDTGLALVQVRWPDGWLVAPPGEEIGPALLACRPASATAWIYENLYLPAVPSEESGTCGFCLTGNSGGASQAAYALARYGLAPIIDGAIFTSGPPHTSLDAGCGGDSPDPALVFEARTTRTIDASYGARSDGPCTRKDPAFQERFAQDSVDGAPLPDLSGVRMQVIVGAADPTSAPSHARLFARWLGDLEVLDAPGMPHTIQQSQSGIDLLVEELAS